MEYKENLDFVKGMNLTRSEIETFERFVDLVEKAQKDQIGFAAGREVAFTPGALLVVAVARFVYEVYQDYGRLAADPAEFQQYFKGVIQKINELETQTGESAGLDTYTKLRKDLVTAKRTSK